MSTRKTRHVVDFTNDWNMMLLWGDIVSINLSLGPITILYIYIGVNTFSKRPKFSIGLLGLLFHYDSYKVPIEHSKQ